MAERTLPTQAELRRIFDYDPDTGALTWRVSVSSRARPGHRAGYPKPDGRRCVRLQLRRYFASRIIWCWVTGAWPPDGMQVDHKDCDASNDRWDNLRLATGSQNRANVRLSSRNTSGLKGVSWHSRGKKWCSQIEVRGNHRFLGLFGTPEEAHAAYCRAAQELNGEFARTE